MFFFLPKLYHKTHPWLCRRSVCGESASGYLTQAAGCFPFYWPSKICQYQTRAAMTAKLLERFCRLMFVRRHAPVPFSHNRASNANRRFSQPLTGDRQTDHWQPAKFHAVMHASWPVRTYGPQYNWEPNCHPRPFSLAVSPPARAADSE